MDVKFALSRLIMAAGLGSAFSAIALAREAPLSGNSLDLSWTENRQVMNRRGDQFSAPVRFHVQVYVSSKGRFFTKVSAVNRRGEAKNIDVIAEDGGDSGVWQWRLAANGAVGVGRIGRSGARQIEVNVNGGGRCSMRVAVAKKVGEDSIVKRNRNGKRIEILSTQVVGTACSFHQGNIFSL